MTQLNLIYIMFIGINWNIKIIQLKESLNKLRNINARLVKRNNFLFKQNQKLKERLQHDIQTKL
jgi:regulator of replication initiation timing